MNAEFNWWLLIVGLVAGAGLVWLVLADSNRRESEIADEEVPTEAAWIAESLNDRGEWVDPATVEQVLRLHRTYLTAPPPDDAEREPDADFFADPLEDTEPEASRTASTALRSPFGAADESSRR